MSTAMVKRQGLRLDTIEDMQRFAVAAFASGVLRTGDQKTSVATAVMAIQYGAELGLGPMQSLQGIHIVKGNPTMGAGMIASLVKASGRYNYRVVKHTDTECSVQFFEQGQPCGVSTFTLEDAKRAGLLGNATWKSFPRNMLFARAMSNGARWYCADVFAGSVYTPDEIEQSDYAPDEIEQSDYAPVASPADPSRLMAAMGIPEEPHVEPDPEFAGSEIDEDGVVQASGDF